MDWHKTENLLGKSRDVLLDCCLENGAIVAANSDKPYYDRQAKYYNFVWPRDASFTCIAADLLGIEGVQEKYFDWLMNRAEGWKEKGVFYEKYYPNGLKARTNFQPDQTGAVLYAVWHHYKDKKEEAIKYEELVVRSANSLCDLWTGTHFKVITQDLWEERHTFPFLKDNFSYSLGACIKGLRCANEMFPNERYLEVAGQMQEILLGSTADTGYFYRSFGLIDDRRIDASLIGLIWPFEIVSPESSIARNTVNMVKEKIVKDYSVYRYEHDEYDGWMHEKMEIKKGAGYWPLLNFWLSTVLLKMGEADEAREFREKVLSDLKNDFIPEQIFNNDIQRSVSPLCWSHVMLIFLLYEQGLQEVKA